MTFFECVPNCLLPNQSIDTGPLLPEHTSFSGSALERKGRTLNCCRCFVDLSKYLAKENVEYINLRTINYYDQHFFSSVSFSRFFLVLENTSQPSEPPKPRKIGQQTRLNSNYRHQSFEMLSAAADYRVGQVEDEDDEEEDTRKMW